MKIPKTSTMVAAAAIALGLTTAGIGITHAATSTTPNNPMSNLVSAIAQKFNLNAADVQKVFDDQRAQMDAQREADYKTRIAADVTAGKITQDQADKIIAKQAELQTQREANKTSLEAEQTALKQWATDNNIPLQYLMFGFGGPGGGHGHGPGGFRN